MLQTSYRTFTCADARLDNVGQQATLAGWVNRRRDLGQLIFLDLRDRHGITQVVIDNADSPEAHAVAESVRSEYVVRVSGTITKRREGMQNDKLDTGTIELRATEIEVLSAAQTPPFPINEPEAEVDEALRLRYRYLDLRREPLQQRIIARGRLVRAIREAHHAAGFVEIETPLLIKSTPEGARDFIVPSRLQPGSVYALPQSPQQMKQLLMVSGFDRYYQIARCLRDEDLRGDRQPEFTQLDLEMSFVDDRDVMAWVEEMTLAVTKAVAPERPLLNDPFPRFTYREAIDRYGTDKPDVRYGMELHDLGELAGASGFRVFESVLGEGGRVFGFAATGMGGATRKQIDGLTEMARKAGAGGLVWLALDGEGGIRGSIVKIVGEEMAHKLATEAGAGAGDLVLIVAAADITAQEVLGTLRVELADRNDAYDRSILSYVWIYQFPMYQWDADNDRWDATHNPFSAVLREDEPLLTTTSGDPLVASAGDPAGRARAQQYDIALNGWELGGGSVRFHTREMLSKSFALMGHSPEAQEAQFSGILKAFEYGAPPHGGIALGIDRWIALLAHQSNIREVMAFPKTSSGSDLMLDAPSRVAAEQLDELGLALKPQKPAARP
ncbi:MAG: aspartate--tRNA ligase [Chloroflexota bacterium]|nr:aspartate--tRNA ligase [Chloroflexota bacterium]